MPPLRRPLVLPSPSLFLLVSLAILTRDPICVRWARREIDDLFSLFDTDDDGRLSRADVARILTLEAEGAAPLSIPQVDKLLAKFTGEMLDIGQIAEAWAPPTQKL